ncbi:aldo/keto reductase [Cerasicoccus arenae]|uniref:Oxidoreductase n=1 Tax=Cerasicoccus arenae TaxID=424488 RepID=A0A8J3DAV9_9BACT|nr:aldo/keto reductase [Cerasicoccus arenae]MBK1856683.1 aldo/keto reductase [Cerasicoccus arenae]GHB98890.1 oxidoreductase [Cerasicoccus arenae]
MHYRRFGRTELKMPVITAGGMRYQQSWNDLPADEITAQEQERISKTIHRALELGINHIETARGYGSSERQLGVVLKDIPRDSYILQSKVAPKEDPKEFEQVLEETFDRLGCDYLDLFGFHGLNTDELTDWTIRKGGCMEVTRRWQKDGRIRYIGFSTHGTCDTIIRAIETGEFDYVNLHWYFINQTNWQAIEAATKQDMGVFIISPNDKGGQLYNPPPKLVDLCAPLTPMGFNSLFCLRRPEVHTLSVGAAQPDQYDPQIEALAYYDNIDAVISPIEDRINAAMVDALGADWWPNYTKHLPTFDKAPGEINLIYILRLWSLAKGLDMDDYGKYRYGMIGNGGHWMAGQKAGNFDDAEIIKAVNGHQFADRIPSILREAHEMFKGKERERLSST